MLPGPDGDRQAAQALLDDAVLGPRRVLAIDEAELLALDGHGHRIAPLLTLGPAIEDATRSRLVDEAAQRMLATGSTGDGTPLGGMHGGPEPTVHTVLSLRRSWTVLVLIDQRTSISREWAAAYLRADGRALTEIATRDGMHTFGVLTRSAALQAVAEILTPLGSPDAVDSLSRTYPIESVPELVERELSSATVVSTVTVRRVDWVANRFHDDRFTVYNLADRAELLESSGAEMVDLTPMSRQLLRTRVDTMTRET